MAKDVRALREEATAATAAGKHKRALAAYLELERVEPRDAQWPKRAAETYRRLGNTKNAIEAFNRSAERYAANGFLVQAIAVCKLVLQIDPQHADTLRRLAQMNEQIGAGPTRAAGMAENNPGLHENPNVAAIRRASTGSETAIRIPGDTLTPPLFGNPVNVRQKRDSDPLDALARPRKDSQQLNPIREPVDELNNPQIAMSRTRTSTPPITVARTKSKPITLLPDAAIDSLQLSKTVPESQLRNESTPGIHVIPIEEEDYEERTSELVIEVEVGEDREQEVDESTELEIDDIEEIPLPAPRAIGLAAQRALAATPLFAGLPREALEALVENLSLVRLERGEHLFREGDPGDALYVIVEGEVSVSNEGPPRVEMSRLGPGSFIGEVALMTDQPRTATVTSITMAELLRIDRATLSRVLGSHGDMLRAVLRFVRDRLVDRWTRTSPLFRPFNDAQRAELAAKFKFLEIDPGTKMLSAGVRPDGLYIVLGGQFNVLRAGSTIAVLGAGDLIGETSLLSGGVFKSDVIARGKCLALCLPAADFREVIMTHPHVLEYIGEHAEHSRRLQIL
jgi:CRP-like cAMP-binding protein